MISPLAAWAVAKRARPPPVVALFPAWTRPPTLAHYASNAPASGRGSSHHIVCRVCREVTFTTGRFFDVATVVTSGCGSHFG